MRHYNWSLFILLFLLLSACSQDSIFEGISDDSSHDTKIDDAKTDLDNADYDNVITSLSSSYTTTALNPEIGQILASAYMGKAWVDTTLYVANSTSSGVDPFDRAASMFSSPKITVDSNGRFIAGSEMSELISNITLAKETLYTLERNGKATNDHLIQLGLVSVAHLILYTSNQSAVAMNYTLVDTNSSNDDEDLVSAPISTSAYEYYSKSRDYNLAGISPGVFKDKTQDGSIYLFQEDLLNINHALASFSAEYPGRNEFRNSLYNFISDVLGAESDEEITDELIMSYTTYGLYTYIIGLAE